MAMPMCATTCGPFLTEIKKKRTAAMAQREKWQTQDEEDEERRALLRKARKGDAKAQALLLESYGVRLYTEPEKAALTYENPKFHAGPRRQPSRKKQP
jgi:hypothetical protein